MDKWDDVGTNQRRVVSIKLHGENRMKTLKTGFYDDLDEYRFPPCRGAYVEAMNDLG